MIKWSKTGSDRGNGVYGSAMKRLVIYVKSRDVVPKLSLAIKELGEMGVEVLESAGRGTEPESGPEELCLTDVPEFAAALAAAGRPVIAYVHEGNRGASLPGVRYVLEGAEAGAWYFIRVWQRFAGKPWHILDTERCMVREMVEEDLDVFYEIYAQPSATAYMQGLHPDREQERQLLQAYRVQMYGFYEFGMWMVVLKETGEVIGRAGLDMPMEDFEEPAWTSAPALGYVIGEPWQGRGLAEEVCRGILDYAREDLGFDRMRARVHPENIRSIRLLEKLGFAPVSVQGETVVYGKLL